MMGCIFCEKQNCLYENELAKAFWDEFPVSKGHVLLVPKRHVEDYFGLTSSEREALADLLQRCKTDLDEKLKPDGYNIGANVGLAAGQSVFHCHVHLIPRYKGDVKVSKGGVRGVIPEKQSY